MVHQDCLHVPNVSTCFSNVSTGVSKVLTGFTNVSTGFSGSVFDVAAPGASRGLPEGRLEPVGLRDQDHCGQKRATQLANQPGRQLFSVVNIMITFYPL
jgi:hypothetical protein